MTKDEFKKIVLALTTAYPSSQAFQTQEAMTIWYTMLQDFDYKVCQTAVLEIISTSKFHPSIAEIREKCSGMTSLPVKDWGEAWENVLTAIRKFGYPEELKALESMDELTRKCVKRIGFQNICMSENISADRANFRMIYETEANRKKTDNQIPEKVRNDKQLMIDELTANVTKKIGSADTYNSYPQRNYTAEDYAEIEKQLLGGR